MAITTALVVTSMAASVASSISSGLSQQANYKAKASASRASADVDVANAARTRVETGMEQDIAGQTLRQEQSKDIVSSLEGGSFSGSGGDIVSQNLGRGIEDIDAIGYRGESMAINFLNKANLSKFEAKQYEAAASKSVVQGVLGGATSMLSTATRQWGTK